MTCLQAVSRGNASAPGNGRGVGVGGLSGHLCAQVAESRVKGKVSSLSPCLGHGSGYGSLGMDGHCACVKDREELGDKTERKRTNMDRELPTHQAWHTHSHPLSSEPHFADEETESQRLNTLPGVTQLASGRPNLEIRPQDTTAHIFGDLAPVKTGSLYGVPAPQEYLRPLPPTPKQPRGAGAEDTSARVWAAEQRQPGKNPSCSRTDQNVPLVGEAFGRSLLPKFEKGSWGLRAPLEPQTPSLPAPSPTQRSLGRKTLASRPQPLTSPFLSDLNDPAQETNLHVWFSAATWLCAPP